jgi:hypothetical protein
VNLQNTEPILEAEKPTEVPSETEIYIQELFNKHPDYNNHLAGHYIILQASVNVTPALVCKIANAGIKKC